jgi:hypothetical protein
LKVERIHLGPLFVQLSLTTNQSSDLAYYAVSTNAVASQSAIVPASWIDGHYIIGTVLGLYTNNGTGPVDSSQILTTRSKFVYEGGFWRNDMFGLVAISGGGGGSGASISSAAYSIVTNFLAAPANMGSGASNQSGVVLAMINYMNAYDAWAAPSLPIPSFTTPRCPTRSS